MAKKAEKVPDGVAIERTVWVPSWGYNFLVERAERQPWRNVKAELSHLLEQALRDAMKAEGKEPGPWVPELLEAA
jgi:hypothetical protein